MSVVYHLSACSGAKIDVREGQTITVTDLEGGQVVDFFAEVTGDEREFLSTGVTMDINESIRLHVGDTVYTNLYRPMLKVLSDDVGEHDLFHPCCRPEMYDFFYHNGTGHSSCLTNINNALGEERQQITPINLFMYSRLRADGSFEVLPPPSKAGDSVVFEALRDVTLGVAACSVSESMCNSGCCTPIDIIIN